MSLYVRVFSNFYTHRKTAKLRVRLGDAALWVPPRLWAYAAENQPDGNFQAYSPREIAMQIGYLGNASAMLRAMLEAGFMDADPLRIHDWKEHNGYHESFSIRGAKGAAARWKGKGKEKTGQERKGKEASNASSILELTREPPAKPDCYPPEARVALFYLNEKSHRQFRETAENLGRIAARLKEPGVTIDGVRKMIDRQCEKWLNTEQADYLRPETLFGPQKFDGYYAAKDQPIPVDVSPAEKKKLEDSKAFVHAMLK